MSSGENTDGAAGSLDWSEGPIPAVAQDADTDEVLMLAYVTPEALSRTRETGLAHYHSRSRDELWRKGESSGHVQHVTEIRKDCDGDTLLYRVEQDGGACHTGYKTCFYRTLDGDVVGEQVFDPTAVYDSAGADTAHNDAAHNDAAHNDAAHNDAGEAQNSE